MASRRVYTDADRAKAAVMLQANGGNLTRASKDLGFPKMTVAEWKKKWDKEGYPEAVSEAIPEATGDVLQSLTKLQKLSLASAISALEAGEVKGKDAAWILGVVTDKIRLLQGQATSRSESVKITLPDAKEVAKELASFVANTHGEAVKRDAEIKEAVTEQGVKLAPLPPAD